MKYLYIIVSTLLLSTDLMAQNKDTKEADKLFDRLEYVDAAKSYSELVKNTKDDGYVYKQLADCYFNVFNTKEAVKCYAKAVETPQNAETHFRYAQMLKVEGNIEVAEAQMEQFAQMEPNDGRAKTFKNNPKYLSQLKSQSNQYEAKKSDVSSFKADFGAVLTNNNELYFTSARNSARKASNIDEEHYLDIYKATRNPDGSFSLATEVTELNTKWHDGPATLSADGNTIYYGSESFNESEFQKNKEKRLKYGQIYLYKATKDGDKWTNSKPLPFNSKNYSARNPSISKDGKKLYFSSNMPGGLGGEDIWKVSVDGETYGTPENLGANVNTEANESFPSIQDDNILFFSSNGKQGFGGYDVFKQNTNTNEKAINIGEPVNSQKDDFAFSYNLEKNVGYFSSNREGNDNIYQAKVVCGVDVTVVIKDAETGTLLSEVNITLVNTNDVDNGIQVSNEIGETKFGIACEEIAHFKATRSGYVNGLISMEKSQNGAKTIVLNLISIKPIITEKEIILQEVNFEFDKSNITQQGANELSKLVQIMKENPEIKIMIKSHTDQNGSDAYNMNLSEIRAQTTLQYIISKGIENNRVSGKGYGKSEPKIKCKKCTEEEYLKNRRSEFIIIK